MEVPIESLELAHAVAQAALTKKADNLVVLDVAKLTSFADYLVLLSAQSERQVHAIAGAIADTLKDQGIRPIGTEGGTGAQWVLVDYGSVVAHVFHESARHYYNLEEMWREAPRIVVEEPRPATATR